MFSPLIYLLLLSEYHQFEHQIYKTEKIFVLSVGEIKSKSATRKSGLEKSLNKDVDAYVIYSHQVNLFIFFSPFLYWLLLSSWLSTFSTFLLHSFSLQYIFFFFYFFSRIYLLLCLLFIHSIHLFIEFLKNKILHHEKSNIKNTKKSNYLFEILFEK